MKTLSIRIPDDLMSALQLVGKEEKIEPSLFPEDPVEYFCGIFKGGPSLTKALLRDRKEERKREEKKGF